MDLLLLHTDPHQLLPQLNQSLVCELQASRHCRNYHHWANVIISDVETHIQRLIASNFNYSTLYPSDL